ncbi:restriction endonuclease [Candidatus Microgenomates bacterium]|nr:restriction endonuclease [Candidatus Microgenomates bacterium]
MSINVVKASGEIEPFSEEKVRASLRRAGADNNLTSQLVSHVKGELYNGIPTKVIYSHIFDLLRKEKSRLSSRYNLKEAIMQLGPTGFPFEKFVAGILGFSGYSCEVGKIVRGKCVAHEIDVAAQKDNERLMIECKYHNQPGAKTDIKTALYVYARFLDVQESFNQGWLVTNTKATTDARVYAECVGLKLISWDWPPENSLRFLIEKSGLHPITALNFLDEGEKKDLLAKGVVFQKDLPREFIRSKGE